MFLEVGTVSLVTARCSLVRMNGGRTKWNDFWKEKHSVGETFGARGQPPGMGQPLSVKHFFYHEKAHRREGLGAQISGGPSSLSRTESPTSHSLPRGAAHGDCCPWC